MSELELQISAAKRLEGVLAGYLGSINLDSHAVLVERARKELKKMDLNGDGVVDQAEFVAAGGTADEFNKCDLNADGVLNEQELQIRYCSSPANEVVNQCLAYRKKHQLIEALAAFRSDCEAEMMIGDLPDLISKLTELIEAPVAEVMSDPNIAELQAQIEQLNADAEQADVTHMMKKVRHYYLKLPKVCSSSRYVCRETSG